MFLFLETKHAAVVKELNDKKALDDGIKKKINAALDEFKTQFIA